VHPPGTFSAQRRERRRFGHIRSGRRPACGKGRCNRHERTSAQPRVSVSSETHVFETPGRSLNAMTSRTTSPGGFDVPPSPLCAQSLPGLALPGRTLLPYGRRCASSSRHRHVSLSTAGYGVGGMSEPTDASADKVPGPRTTAPTSALSPKPGCPRHGPDALPEAESGSTSQMTVCEPQMRFVDVTGSREAAGRSIRMRDMARLLPKLVRRSLALAASSTGRAHETRRCRFTKYRRDGLAHDHALLRPPHAPWR
jgi:hypothetical protein